MANELGGGGSTFKPKPPPTPEALAAKGQFGYLPPAPAPGGVAPWMAARMYAAKLAAEDAVLPPVDLGWMNDSGGSGGVGDAAVPVVAAPLMDPLSNPAYLAALAGIDAAEAGAIGDVRTRQDAARRALSDLLGDISDRAVKSEGRTKDSQEGRGLLRSGATERLLADVSESANDEKARGETSTADSISTLERSIAEAKIASQQKKADLGLQYAGLTG